MNNYGYLLTRTADLEAETLSLQEGKVAKLQELAIAVGGSSTIQDAQAKLELERQSLSAPTPADEDFGTPEWHYRKGEIEAVALVQTKLDYYVDTITFVPDYTPPTPQYEKELGKEKADGS